MGELRRYVVGLTDGDILRLERLAERLGVTESKVIRDLLADFEEALNMLERAVSDGDTRAEIVIGLTQELAKESRDRESRDIR